MKSSKITKLEMQGFISVVLRASQMLLMTIFSIVVARVAGPEAFGLYSYFIALVMVCVVVAQFGTPVLIVHETAKMISDADAAQVANLWASVRTFVLQTSSVIAVAIYAYLVTINPNSLLEPILLAASIPLIVVAQCYSARLRGLRMVILGQMYDALFRPLMLVTLVVVSINFGGETLTVGSLVGNYFLAAILGLFGVKIISDIKSNLQYPTAALTRPKMHCWIRRSFPFAILSCIQIFSTYIDTLMLSWMASDEDVGIYRAMAQFTMLISFGLAAVNQMLQPHLSRLFILEKKLELQRLVTWSSRVILIIGLAPFCIYLVLADLLIDFILGPAYSSGLASLYVLSVGQLANVIFGSVGSILNMTGNEMITVRAMAIALVLNLILGAMLIPSFGLLGAAISTSVGLTAWNSILWWAIWKKLKLDSSPLGLVRRSGF